MERQFEAIRFIKQRLVDGVYVPGDRLPNRWDLERDLGASRATVQSAFDRLILEGFVESRGRAGTFVAGRPPYLNCFGLVLMDDEADWKNRGQFARALVNEAAAWARTHETEFRVYEGVEPANEANESFVRLLADMRGHRLAGLLLVTPPPQFMGEALLSLPGIPMITLQALEASAFPGVASMWIDRPQFMLRALDAVAESRRRRVGGMILASTLKTEDFRKNVIDPIRARGMETRSHWWQFVSHADPNSASHAAQLLMRLPRGEAPDALIIEDDSLVEAATSGLAKAGIGGASDLVVIARANFPHPTPSHVPAARIGLHIGRILHDAVDGLKNQRLGKKARQRVRLVAKAEDEWDAIEPGIGMGVPVLRSRSKTAL